MASTKKYPLLKVIWKDTYTENGWSANPTDTVPIISVGYLVNETEDTICLSSMISMLEGESNCKQAIHKGSITERKQIGRVELKEV